MRHQLAGLAAALADDQLRLDDDVPVTVALALGHLLEQQFGYRPLRIVVAIAAQGDAQYEVELRRV